MKKILWVMAFTAMFSTANADMQIANEQPKLSGAVGQAALPTDSRVCPGSPVVLTVGLNPPLAIAGGAIPVISYTILEGRGWFGPMEDMKIAPLGPFGIFFGRMLARFGNQHAVAPLNAETGSTAIVFHPLGKEGDTIRIRAKGEGQAENLGSVEFVFHVGANHEYLLSRLAENGLNIEKRTERIHYEEEEYADVKTALASGNWSGVPRHVFRTLYAKKVTEKDLNNPTRDLSTVERLPLDVKNSIYARCRYWGETTTAIVGCLTDPSPPGPDGTLMLYYFSKNTGLLTEFRFYGKSSCGWTNFLWNPDVGGGLPYTIQIQRRVWNPPTKLQETVDIFRQNIRILPDEPPEAPPTPYDPSRDPPEQTEPPQ